MEAGDFCFLAVAIFLFICVLLLQHHQYYLQYSGNPTACASVEKQCQTDFTGKNWGLSKRDSRDKGIRGTFAAPRRLTNQIYKYISESDSLVMQ